ncbi:hypothetical protein [Streptomyces sp. NPDC088812]|uniref:hypothetical protein n=1 Tax=Streptomyces sp. NPDC088812 TaxID=3365905 RepID=UPI003822121F
MSVSPSWSALAGVVVLGATLTACGQGEALGTIDTRNAKKELVETISNPRVDGCHRFRAGVTHVANYTVNDLVLYPTADCTEPPGGQSTYLGTQLADTVAPSQGTWRSFTIVH